MVRREPLRAGPVALRRPREPRAAPPPGDAPRRIAHPASRRWQSSELLALTYGALVAQLVEDYEDPEAINVQLEKMCAARPSACPPARCPCPRRAAAEPRLTCRRGYNIGMRIVEEFLAKTAELPLWSRTPCADFREAMEVLSKVGFKMFLGVTADTRWTSDNEVALIFKEEIPLNDFVELPETLSALHYSNIVCGVVRGALEMVRRDYPRRLPHRPACRSQPPAQCHVHGWWDSQDCVLRCPCSVRPGAIQGAMPLRERHATRCAALALS